MSRQIDNIFADLLAAFIDGTNVDIELESAANRLLLLKGLNSVRIIDLLNLQNVSSRVNKRS
jgi:hypothetical protein